MGRPSEYVYCTELIAENVRRIMESKGIRIKDLQHPTPWTVHCLLNGRKKRIRRNTLMKLSKALDTEVTEFFTNKAYEVVKVTIPKHIYDRVARLCYTGETTEDVIRSILVMHTA